MEKSKQLLKKHQGEGNPVCTRSTAVLRQGRERGNRRGKSWRNGRWAKTNDPRVGPELHAATGKEGTRKNETSMLPENNTFFIGRGRGDKEMDEDLLKKLKKSDLGRNRVMGKQHRKRGGGTRRKREMKNAIGEDAKSEGPQRNSRKVAGKKACHGEKLLLVSCRRRLGQMPWGVQEKLVGRVGKR